MWRLYSVISSARRITSFAFERSSERVAQLPAVVTALNNEVTCLTGKKPKDAIRVKTMAQKPSLPANRPVGLHEPLIPSDAIVRYLYASGEQEGGRWRATDCNWSLTEHSMRNVVRQGGQPALYYLTEGPARCFVREELLIMPPGTELPPDWVLTRPAAR